MYAFIDGILEEKTPEQAVISAGGVGYLLLISRNTYDRLAGVGERQKLHTCFVVREDAMTLYGFADKEEKNMFERLVSVSGVGPKVALAALSGLSVSELAVAIIAGDERAFSRVSGIGKKTAQRIILELKEKVGTEEAIATTGMVSAPQGIERQAIAGLAALGYGQSEAALAVSNVAGQADTVEELILLALKQFDRS